MTEQSFHVVAGIDTHADAHAAAVLDAQGKPLADDIFPATTGGYRQLTDWLQSFGQLDAVGVEGSGGYGAGLTRYLQARNLHVVEVNRPHPHTRSRRGKTDSIDAEAAARKVQAGECTAMPKDTSGIVEAIRQIHLARASAVKARATALAQFGQMVTTAPDPVRDALTAKSVKGKTNQAATFQPDRSQLHDPAQATKLALCSIADRIHSLDTEIAHLDHQLSSLVRHTAPRTLELTGIGTVHAAQMLITAGQNIDRLHSEAACARLCAASPIPASSGKTTRHRLNPFGDRDANRTLHLIAVVRLRYCDRTRSYSARRTADGLSKLGVICCLKRYIPARSTTPSEQTSTNSPNPLDHLQERLGMVQGYGEGGHNDGQVGFVGFAVVVVVRSGLEIGFRAREGHPHGLISSLLANLFMHYAFPLYHNLW